MAQAERDLLHTEIFAMMPNAIKYKYADNLKLTRDVIIRDFMFGPAGLNLDATMATPKGMDEAGEIETESTAWAHLKQFQDHPQAGPFVKALKTYNATCKTVDTYCIGFLADLRSDGRFHPSYILAKGGQAGDEDEGGGTNTGRSSCKNPAYQCLVAETEILTTIGRKKLVDVIGAYENGYPVEVLTHTGMWQPVAGVHRNGVQPTYRVIMSSGKTIVCTGNHPILTVHGFIRADQLRLGLRVYTIGSYGKDHTRPLSERQEQNLSDVGEHDGSLLQRLGDVLALVRRSRYTRVRRLARLRDVLRRYGGNSGWDDLGARKRGLRLLERERAMVAAFRDELEQTEHAGLDLQWEDSARRGLGARDRVRRSIEAQIAEGLARGQGTWDALAAYEAGFAVEEIAKIESGGDRETFDLSVDESHSFVSHSFVAEGVPDGSVSADALHEQLVAGVDVSDFEMESKVNYCPTGVAFLDNMPGHADRCT